MTRPAAQAAVQALCLEAVNTGADLIDLAERRFPGRGWHGIIGPGLMGQAPQEARDFAAAVGAGRPDRPQGE